MEATTILLANNIRNGMAFQGNRKGCPYHTTFRPAQPYLVVAELASAIVPIPAIATNPALVLAPIRYSIMARRISMI